MELSLSCLFHAQKKLEQSVKNIKRSAHFAKMGISTTRGILLHGPPGCSKTTLAKAAANATQASLFSLRFEFIFHNQSNVKGPI